MKFKFKIQAYQTDAVENTTNIFVGHPNRDPSKYRRDLGKRGSGVIPTESTQPYAGKKYGGDASKTPLHFFLEFLQHSASKFSIQSIAIISEKFTKFAFK